MIFVNEFREFIRDHSNLFFIVAFPLILILLLGTMLSKLNYADEEVGFIEAEYQVDTLNTTEQTMITAFISSLNETGSVKMKEAVSTEQAKAKIQEESLDALVVFSDGEIQLFEGKNDIKNRSLKAILNGYLQNKKSVIATLSAIKDEKLSYVMAEDLMLNQKRDFTTETEFNKNRTMMDYYGVTMIVMIVFIGGMGGFAGFENERKNGTINRLIASPLSKNRIYIEKVFGMMLSSVLEILVLMIASVLLFRVKYAATLSDNFLLFLLFFITMFMMGSIGISVGLFMRGNPTLIFGPVLWIMMFFSGTYSKETFIEGVSPYLPIYQIQQAAFGLTVFGKRDKALVIIAIELVVTLIAMGLGIIKFRHVQQEKG